MKLRKFQDVDITGKKILVRSDLNVPMEDGKITDDFRIVQSAETIRELIARGATQVIIVSHMGRPKGITPELTLRPIAERMSEVLGLPVGFGADASGDVIMLENIRFDPREEKNDPAFAAELAARADIYINDAFGTAHRAHASTEGITKIIPSYAGLLIQREVAALTKIVDAPKRPLLAIIAGAKISTKIEMMKNLVKKADAIIIGGAMGNTFRFAQGYGMGKSLYEANCADIALEILAAAEDEGCRILLPTDKAVAKVPEKCADSFIRGIDEIEDDDIILDAGPESITRYLNEIDQSGTILWNGPVGMFEWPNFSRGSVAIARHLAKRTIDGKIISVAGGGDTVAVLTIAGVLDKLSYVSTAGGAFMEFIEGKILPGVAALEDK
ncbi:MAG: phosphoglycerate kinase [Rickettsiales bacterium]|jgi:phosphoglycerate kinase|nr:phosphoglycerate kinase [Rickettsiales bacterium]